MIFNNMSYTQSKQSHKKNLVCKHKQGKLCKNTCKCRDSQAGDNTWGLICLLLYCYKIFHFDTESHRTAFRLDPHILAIRPYLYDVPYISLCHCYQLTNASARDVNKLKIV